MPHSLAPAHPNLIHALKRPATTCSTSALLLSRKRPCPQAQEGCTSQPDCNSSNKVARDDLQHFLHVEEVAQAEDRSSAYRVLWADGSKTWESPEFRQHVNGKDPARWAWLMAMASRYNDSPETLRKKQEQRTLYVKGLARGERRSSRNHASSRSIDAQKQLEPVEVLYTLPQLFIEVCQACDATTTVLRCRQGACSQHLCLHHYEEMRDGHAGAEYAQVAPPHVGFYCPTHGGPPYPKTVEVTLSGLARSQPTGFHIVTKDETFAPRITVQHHVVSKAEAEVLLIDMHTRTMEPGKFQQDVEAGLSGMGKKVQLVFVFACWRLPDEQAMAMMEISERQASITFVLFRVPSLVPTAELLSQCIRAADQTMRYPTALPYLALARLSVEQRSVVIFEHGKGPLRLGLQSSGVPTCDCSGNNKQSKLKYSSESKKWWKVGVRRKFCRGGKCPGLLWILDVIPERLVDEK